MWRNFVTTPVTSSRLTRQRFAMSDSGCGMGSPIVGEFVCGGNLLNFSFAVLVTAVGLPGKRYYGGCEFVDIAETLAIERAQKLFNAEHVNVQPHSGAQANQAVYM